MKKNVVIERFENEAHVFRVKDISHIMFREKSEEFKHGKTIVFYSNGVKVDFTGKGNEILFEDITKIMCNEDE